MTSIAMKGFLYLLILVATFCRDRCSSVISSTSHDSSSSSNFYCTAFSIHSFTRSSHGATTLHKSSSVQPLLFDLQTLRYGIQLYSTSEDSATNKRKRRTKRKQPSEDTSEDITDNEWQPPMTNSVSLPVNDVRQVVASTSAQNQEQVSRSDSITSSDSKSSFSKVSDPTPSPTTVRSSSISSDNSLEQLLADAKAMQEAEQGKATRDGGALGDSSNDDGSGGTLKSKIGNVLSTIVTIDFFVVVGFLLWFLAGVFCSAVLKDDTVQIAFNSNFQAFVQPALGVLMIAAIGGSVFGKEEEDEKFNT